MKHLFKILLVLFLCNANLRAGSKNDFREGYIISLKGDTTKGFLLTQISTNASKKCIFKLSADSEYKTYEPNEISGYRYLNDKYYVSKEISIDSLTKKLVFMEFLIKGMASVYYYVDNEEHYFIENSNGLFELTEKQRMYENEGHNYAIPSRAKGKLLYMLKDCPDINNEIQNTRLTHKSLIKLTKNYHEKVCDSESCIVYEKNNTSPKLKLGMLVGASTSKYNFGGQLVSNYGNNFQLGAALKLSNIFMFNEHLSLKANFIFEKDLTSYTLSKSQDNVYYFVTYNDIRYPLNFYNSIDAKKSLQADLNVIDIKIPITLNYDISISKKTFFTFGVGISNKIILSQNKNLKIEEFYREYGKSINSLLSGLVVTTGIEGKWFGKHTQFLNVGYERFSDFRSRVDSFLKLSNPQYSIQAGIYF